MTELDYVVEKVELALNIMATGDGDLKSRLTDAWNYEASLAGVNASSLSEELRATFNKMEQSMCRINQDAASQDYVREMARCFFGFAMEIVRIQA